MILIISASCLPLPMKYCLGHEKIGPVKVYAVNTTFILLILIVIYTFSYRAAKILPLMRVKRYFLNDTNNYA
jgi:hypothetical protein